MSTEYVVFICHGGIENMTESEIEAEKKSATQLIQKRAGQKRDLTNKKGTTKAVKTRCP